MSNILNRLETWRIERGLDVSQGFKFDQKKQVSFLIEEITEYLRANSDNERIDALCDITIFSLNAMNLLNDKYLDLFSDVFEIEEEKFDIVDIIDKLWYVLQKGYDLNFGFMYIIEISRKIIEDLGYDYFKVMNETLKEIESRKGEFNIHSGKWEKFKDDESKKLWYKADYESCKL